MIGLLILFCFYYIFLKLTYLGIPTSVKITINNCMSNLVYCNVEKQMWNSRGLLEMIWDQNPMIIEKKPFTFTRVDNSSVSILVSSCQKCKSNPAVEHIWRLHFSASQQNKQANKNISIDLSLYMYCITYSSSVNCHYHKLKSAIFFIYFQKLVELLY